MRQTADPLFYVSAGWDHISHPTETLIDVKSWTFCCLMKELAGMASSMFTPLPQQSPEPYEKHISSQTAAVQIIIPFSLNTVIIFFNFKANLKSIQCTYIINQLHILQRKTPFFHSLTSLMRPLELLFFILAKLNMATFCHMAMAIFCYLDTFCQYFSSSFNKS